MKCLRLVPLSVAIAALAICSLANAAPVYNVNMMAFRGSDGGSAAFLAIDGTSATGPAAFTGTGWNDLQVTTPATVPLVASGLKDSDGNVSSIDFEISVGVSSWSDPTFVLDAMKGYAFSTDTVNPVPLKFSGLTPGSTWNIYGMSHGDGNAQFATFDLGGDLRSTANADVRPNATWEENVNYVRYTQVAADAAGEINLSFIRAGGASHAAFNGIQLVSVPEPACVCLMGIATVVGLVVQRRRS